jgi:hypothetical protein
MNMNELFIVGGQEKERAPYQKTWQKYQKGVIVRVDLAAGRAERVLEYVSPPETYADDAGASISFGAATLRDNHLYVCTKTEVLTYLFPAFKQIGYISLPCFNDVHHVRPSNTGTLLVVSTGLDLVVEVTPEGEVVREWNVLGQDPWARFSKEVDYRKVATTKPHQSHPNYVFQLGDDIWVTRFEQHDAVCLTRPGSRFEIGVEKPHDGILYNGRLYFTIVSGYIVVIDAASGKVEKVFNLNQMGRGDKAALGWCRGLKVVDDNRVIVGFSRLRATKFKENIRWVKYITGFAETLGYLPTRVAHYDLEKGKLLWEFELEAFGLNTVFSIH